MIDKLIIRYLRWRAARRTMRSFRLLAEGAEDDRAAVDDLWAGAARLRGAALILEWGGRGPLPRPNAEDG